MVRVTWHHCFSLTASDSACPTHPERLRSSDVSPVASASNPMKCAGVCSDEHLDPAGGGVDALAQRFPVQPDAAADLAGDDDLAVEHTARRQLVAQRVEQLREVPAEILAAAGLQHDVVAVAEHQRPEAVPLRLVGPHPRLVGHLGLRLGQHRLDRRLHGEVHAFHTHVDPRTRAMSSARGENGPMQLPVMPPVSPMLAKSVTTIPPDASYEPKWDGFRSICFRDGDEVELGSRNERPMTRYFPELVAAALAELPDGA